MTERERLKNRPEYHSKRSLQNSTAWERDDINALVCAAFRACRVVMSGGVMIQARRGGPYARVRSFTWKRPPHEKETIHTPAYRSKRFWRVVVGLPVVDSQVDTMAAADVNALAGQLVVGITAEEDFFSGRDKKDDHDPLPWWRHDLTWVDGMVVKRIDPKPPLTIADRVKKREEHCRNMLARAEADAERALARVEKWTRKVKYYDRKERLG